jgi:hypothetical protein
MIYLIMITIGTIVVLKPKRNRINNIEVWLIKILLK